MKPKTNAPRQNAERLTEMDKQFIWHPFTPMRQWLDDEPLVIEAGEGFELIDTAGRRYIDGFSSLWCNLHGHRVAEIDAAVRDQLDKIAHSTLLGHASAPSIELAERLVRITPEPLEKVFYSDSGATAVEVALKMAFQYHRNIGQASRKRFIALREGYHGDTIGAVSVGGISTFGRIFQPLLFEAAFVDSPNVYHHPAGESAGRAVVRQIDAAISEAPNEFCAVIVEPMVQAAGGMLTQPEGFLRGVREVTQKHDVLLICDEVATGFCRTGRGFACEHEDVAPDIMCLGKGLTGGYLPVAATMATPEIFDAFCGDIAEGRTFYHGHTYTGNALGCAAATASVDMIFSSDLLKRMPAKIKLIRRELSELADHPHVGDIRQAGFMVGIELVRDRDKKEPFDPNMRVGTAICRAARSHGIITRPLGDVVVLMPAPAMDGQTLKRLLTGMVATIHEYFKTRRPV
ncbi:MAG: adenosylmethionine--8-amino-7-oxononanoate transaminase [Planctomycetota bacterium]|nr:adenosylmethionine--8-amino-7-oxononanoate transaminase [Planctomycetota bacterium]